LIDEDDTVRAVANQTTAALNNTRVAPKLVIKRQKKHSRKTSPPPKTNVAESCCESDNGARSIVFGQHYADFEVAGAVAKAITAIHHALNVPLEHMKAIANPVLLCTCSSPGCLARTKPSSFFCAEHCSMLPQSQLSRFDNDATSVDHYLAKLRSLAHA
jgi:hypothetical protein